MIDVRPNTVAGVPRCDDHGPSRGDAVRILRGVADLFERPDAWTQHAWCRDADSRPLTRALDPSARCWCFVGAIRKVRGPGMSSSEDRALDAVRRVIWANGDRGETISSWNDAPGRKVEDVRRIAIQAAERLEARIQTGLEG